MDKLIRQLQEIRLDEEDLFPNATPKEVKQRGIEAKRRSDEEVRATKEKWDSFRPGDRVRLDYETSPYHNEVGIVTRKHRFGTSVFAVYIKFPKKIPGFTTVVGDQVLLPGESGAFDVEDLEKVSEETPEDVEIEGVE